MTSELDGVSLPFSVDARSLGVSYVISVVESIAFAHDMNLDDVTMTAPMAFTSAVLRQDHVTVERVNGKNNAVVHRVGGNLFVSLAPKDQTSAFVFHKGDRFGEFIV